ncbi:MAG: MmcQ/YjbR family DNA-binding protein [Bacteroidales bacterium]|nr:MmcQ/YjbR family DNA-binding protein [Bacteroidales bacterium]
MDIERFRMLCLSLPQATEDMPFDDTVVVFRLKGKIFACIATDTPELAVMKCDPERAMELRERYSCVEGAYHWNKKYWNQIRFNEDVDDKMFVALIAHAYNEVNRKLPKKDRVEFLGES